MTAIGIILIVAAIFLVIVVLMQHGKSHNLSGTIAGASETFFGKSKASSIDKKLSIATSVVAVVFVLLVLVAYVISGNSDEQGYSHAGHDHGAETTVSTAAGTEASTDSTDAGTEAPAESTAATEAPVESTDAGTEAPVDSTAATEAAE